MRTVHGREFDDQWEWLREKESQRVIDHLNAENEITEEATADLAPLREAIYKEIKSRVQETDMSVPVRSGGWWYFGRSEEGRSYGLSCRVPAEGDIPPVTTTADGEPLPALEGEQVLLDMDAMAEGHEYFSLGAASVTVDGTLLAYSTDVVGDERYNLRVKDLRTGELLDDSIDGISTGASWVGSEYIFYQTVDDAWRPDSVWRHRIGTPSSEDVRVFHEPDESFFVGAGTTRSEKYLIIEMGSKITSECWYIDTSEPESDPVCIRPRQTGVEYEVEHAIIGGQDKWLITHNLTGPDFALSICDAGPIGDVSDLKDLVPHLPGRRIEGVDCFASFIVLAYREGGIGRLSLWKLDNDSLPDAPTAHFEPLQFPEELYTAGAGGNPEWDTTVFRFGYGSFTTPGELWQLDVPTGERTLLKRQPVKGGYDSEEYVAKRLWVTARDGVDIPVSLVHRADLDTTKPNPLLLYGYGSYEASIDPGFSVARLSLMDRGMIFAIAHVRGGGEMGRGWWENGRGLSKKNTFTDFIDVADYLRESGVTDSMVAEGGSAGGMLMGAVANMAGDRFNGILAAVPFVDPLTSMLMPELPLTVTEWDEWGDPLHDAEVYDYMASYSPYENVGGTYPPILATTSLNDTRVLYVEPAKWIARLKEVADGGPFLLKCEMSAGHGGVSGRYAKWKETAFEYAWLLKQAGAADK